MSSAHEPVLVAEGIKRYFEVNDGLLQSSDTLKAVDSVSFELAEGEVVGLAGESGCGKSTTAMALTQLTSLTDGDVYIDGTNVREMDERELRKRVQYVFQDPFGSSNPMHKIKQVVTEAPRNLTDFSENELDQKAYKSLENVGLEPTEFANKYPHELSGGELQRVSIAAALSVNPDILIADEPTSMLDASNRGRVISIIEEIIEERSISVIYISHNLGVLRQIADRIAIMYLGRIVELGDTDSVLMDPHHPYTAALRSASLIPDPEYEIPEIKIKDEIQKPVDLPQGCNFQNRCPYKGEKCSQDPKLEESADGQQVACFYPLESDEE